MIRETKRKEKSALLRIISDALQRAGMGYVKDGKYLPYHPDYAYLNPVRMADQSLIGRINRESMFDIRVVDDGMESDPRDLTRNTRNIAAIYMADPIWGTEAAIAGNRDGAFLYQNTVAISDMVNGVYLMGRIPKNDRHIIGLLVERITDHDYGSMGCIIDEEALRNRQSRQLIIAKVGDTFLFGDGGVEHGLRVYERPMLDDTSNIETLLKALPERFGTISRQEILN